MGSQHRWPCWLFWQLAISILLVVIKFCSVLFNTVNRPLIRLLKDVDQNEQAAVRLCRNSCVVYNKHVQAYLISPTGFVSDLQCAMKSATDRSEKEHVGRSSISYVPI